MKKDYLAVFIFGHFKNVHFWKLTPNVFQTFAKRASLKEPFYKGLWLQLNTCRCPLYMGILKTWELVDTSLHTFLQASLQPCSKNIVEKTPKNAIFGHFWKFRIKLLLCRRETLFSVPLRKESHFFPKSILCRQSETSH